MKVGDIEITPREILFSTLILAVMLGIGVLISRPILRSVTEDYIKIATTTQVKTPDNFDYIRRTNVGDFLAEGTLVADQPVSIEDISGRYARIKRLYEEYREHEREVTETYTDDKGKLQTRTKIETYWEWDEISHTEWMTKTFEFLGKHFDQSSIHYYGDLGMHSINEFGYHKRYVYYTSPMVVHGFIEGKAENKTYVDTYFKESTIEKLIKSAEFDMKATPIAFWIVWIILSIGVCIGFYAAENRWLED